MLRTLKLHDLFSRGVSCFAMEASPEFTNELGDGPASPSKAEHTWLEAM